jgi:hypothetical protein
LGPRRYPGLKLATSWKPGAATIVLVAPIEEELAPVIGERVEHDDHVLARLRDLVEIEHRARAHRARDGTVLPHGLAAAHQPAPEQIRRARLVVARDGDERALELVGHRLDEARLAAAGRPLEQDRQPLLARAAQHVALVTDRAVVRRGAAPEGGPVRHHAPASAGAAGSASVDPRGAGGAGSISAPASSSALGMPWRMKFHT